MCRVSGGVSYTCTFDALLNRRRTLGGIGGLRVAVNRREGEPTGEKGEEAEDLVGFMGFLDSEEGWGASEAAFLWERGGAAIPPPAAFDRIASRVRSGGVFILGGDLDPAVSGKPGRRATREKVAAAARDVIDLLSNNIDLLRSW